MRKINFAEDVRCERPSRRSRNSIFPHFSRVFCTIRGQIALTSQKSWHNYIYTPAAEDQKLMAGRKNRQGEDAKTLALRQAGALNSHPEKVVDPLFQESDFFDPRDLALVKYEMLRRVRREGVPVAQAARIFGFSRPVFYQALAVLQAEGIAGLIRKRPGPKRAHKLSEEVLDFLEKLLVQDPTLRANELTQRVLDHFGRLVHARSIERALARRKKGRETS